MCVCVCVYDQGELIIEQMEQNVNNELNVKMLK